MSTRTTMPPDVTGDKIVPYNYIDTGTAGSGYAGALEQRPWSGLAWIERRGICDPNHFGEPLKEAKKEEKPSMKLYQYAVLYNPPSTKEDRDAGKTVRPVIVVPISSVVAASEEEVRLKAAGEIPDGFKDKLDRVQVLVRVF